MAQSLPQFLLFGASMTEWSFDPKTEGFGWFLEQTYRGKAHVENKEGFGYMLERKYAGKIRVLNRGRAGYTSTSILGDFDAIITRATDPGAAPVLLFTIFLGANDACFLGETEMVPLPIYEKNIRFFVETILTQDAMHETKIILITPPPINIPSPKAKVADEEDLETRNATKRLERSYRTYMSKKRYAERIVQIASEYEETGRVLGSDFWNDLVRTRLQEVGMAYDETKLPGSGLYGTIDFGQGYFTDALHLDKKGYKVLNDALYEGMVTKWPELAVDKM